VLFFLVVSALLPIYAACAAFAYFAFKSPERLQSEEFQLRKEAVQLMQIRTTATPLDARVLAQIAATPLLEEGPSADNDL
jgi:hypothetical protein